VTLAYLETFTRARSLYIRGSPSANLTAGHRALSSPDDSRDLTIYILEYIPVLLVMRSMICLRPSSSGGSLLFVKMLHVFDRDFFSPGLDPADRPLPYGKKKHNRPPLLICSPQLACPLPPHSFFLFSFLPFWPFICVTIGSEKWPLGSSFPLPVRRRTLSSPAGSNRFFAVIIAHCFWMFLRSFLSFTSVSRLFDF